MSARELGAGRALDQRGRAGAGSHRADPGGGDRDRPASWCADAIAGDGLVHLFGTGHSRIPVEEMFPRYGSYPGFNPIVELSMTFHTQVVGANGQRQAMFIERTPGLAEVILSNFTLRPEGRDDRLLGERADGRPGRDGPGRPPAGAAGHRRDLGRPVARRPRSTRPPGRASSTRPTSSSTCARRRPTRCAHRRPGHAGWPGSRRSAAVAIVNAIKVRIAELLVERGAMPPVITRASVVGAERSRTLFDEAYREHARRLARAIDPATDVERRGGGDQRRAAVIIVARATSSPAGRDRRPRRAEEWNSIGAAGPSARGSRQEESRSFIEAQPAGVKTIAGARRRSSASPARLQLERLDDRPERSGQAVHDRVLERRRRRQRLPRGAGLHRQGAGHRRRARSPSSP